VTNDDKPGWYSVSVEYKPIPSELQPGHGEWYLQATLIHEYSDLSGGIQTENTLLGWLCRLTGRLSANTNLAEI
jgi:hypothetical protein